MWPSWFPGTSELHESPSGSLFLQLFLLIFLVWPRKVIGIERLPLMDFTKCPAQRLLFWGSSESGPIKPSLRSGVFWEPQTIKITTVLWELGLYHLWPESERERFQKDEGQRDAAPNLRLKTHPASWLTLNLRAQGKRKAFANEVWVAAKRQCLWVQGN